ncbi:RING zinc finger-containing protein [Heterostelium album PN500]|uniref:RING zinc finger-containing protein n=1 Tax=Heterostelium pallidum (strain ATCC 26659 / Pp 5 / PN500) TaxID=670386 RepID=D3BT73_HETP5|nr:RING zinc finger-containing protein [Heterostelium album PN500]EFA75290.1 RING zinc finger-containing protein [Heterostelium album PN500]|eukprot:XP_020427424.1 RING zinc finger-containing protein [Heterostelium album PN500]
MTDDQTKYEVSRTILRANRITFSSGTKIGGGLFSIEARWGHTSVSIGKRVFIFGGQGESLYSNTCVYDSTSSVWNELHTLGKGPSSRYAHTATLVEDSSVMVFGGRNNKKYLNDLYCLNLPTMSWSTFHFDKVEPEARAGHTCTFVQSVSGGCNRMVLFGGNHSAKYFTSLYILEFPKRQSDTIRWIKPSVRGSGPSGRTGHTASHIKETENVVFIGGYDGKRSLIDVWMLNTKDYVWTQIKPSGISPSPRHGHTAVSVGNLKSLMPTPRELLLPPTSNLTSEQQQQQQQATLSPMVQSTANNSNITTTTTTTTTTTSTSATSTPTTTPPLLNINQPLTTSTPAASSLPSKSAAADNIILYTSDKCTGATATGATTENTDIE